MHLTQDQRDFIIKNEITITEILNQRISDLKDELLELPEEKRNQAIEFLKEYKIGLGFLKEITNNSETEKFTGI